MCLTCGEFNFTKRNQTADLKGKVALVTGGRVKIGYEVCLKLLRAGASVIATTRFPNDAVIRYAKEPDFEEWKDNLHFYALDLRLLGEVEAFVEHIQKTYSRLDMIINNAAQTIRRPPVFYKHLLKQEKNPLPSGLQSLLLTFGTKGSTLMLDVPTTESLEHEKNLVPIVPQLGALATTAANISPADLTQIPLIDEDVNYNPAEFPNKQLDCDGQQVDLRTENTWSKKLDEVSTVEAAEVHLVNALAPFIINSKLKPLMLKSGDPGYIINVSSMEGKFSRNKQTTHPHTNMAKAAMNMMTRTSSRDFAEDHIYMNSIDTGWITYENPLELTARKQQLGLEPPIDEIDGAARILDPIFVAENTKEYAWGLFFKDYLPSKW
eukprot:TRINITY_DN2123_c0_g1_i1.p1 TRINITY_DN2123_c0_g1~~TRINITY_DN2123_c0_g1_i1.p1  ORF type:complete len:379 (-),score=82.68 TRINITY_DN2123_c0_g1_i1:30-1166(-)